MSQPTGTCPNCGANIVFRWSSSVQTVCEYCKSILVRTDVDLKKVGQVADLPPLAPVPSTGPSPEGPVQQTVASSSRPKPTRRDLDPRAWSGRSDIGLASA